MIEDLLRLLRRTAIGLAVLPLLVPVGLWLGRGTTAALALPDGTPVRSATATTPSIRLAALQHYTSALHVDGMTTAEIVDVYNTRIAPVERSLVRRGIARSTARDVAWPLIGYSEVAGVDPATVLAILWVESTGYPRARSNVGARGLMQVMPAHIGRWRQCSGRDLYNIEINLCYGTHILAEAMQRFRGDERRALLAYNGCVNGTNTPNCWTYPDKVEAIRSQILAEWSGYQQRVASAIESEAVAP